MPRSTQSELVSVVMSTYNHADYVGAAIASVLGQSHENLEFLITDDGSSDGTVEVTNTVIQELIILDQERTEGPVLPSMNL